MRKSKSLRSLGATMRDFHRKKARNLQLPDTFTTTYGANLGQKSPVKMENQLFRMHDPPVMTFRNPTQF